MNTNQKAAQEIRRFTAMLATLTAMGDDLAQIGNAEAMLEDLNRKIAGRKDELAQLDVSCSNAAEDLRVKTEKAMVVRSEIVGEAKSAAEDILATARAGSREIVMEIAGPTIAAKDEEIAKAAGKIADLEAANSRLINDLEKQLGRSAELNEQLTQLQSKLKSLVGG